MITGMDRLVAAISGKTCDRIPVFCNLIDQGAKELKMSIKEYFSRGEHIAEAQIKMREKYDYDNVWSLFYVGKEAELLGCKEIIYAEDGPPNVGEWVIKKYDDIEKLSVPENLSDHPGFSEQRKCLNIMKREVGGRYPICAYITSTMSLPIMLMGMDKWFELLFTGPEDVKNLLLEKCFAFFVNEIAAYKACGADILVYSNPFGSTDTVPIKYFKEHSLPWIKRELQAVGAEGLVYYCGMSRLNNVLDILLEATDFRTFYTSPLDDIAEAVSIIGSRGLTCGVINDIKLLEWGEEDIDKEVKRIINSGKEQGRFLFGTGVMPYNIPETSIRKMLESAYQYGKQ